MIEGEYYKSEKIKLKVTKHEQYIESNGMFGKKAIFTNTELRYNVLIGRNLSGCIIKDGNVTGAKFIECDLSNAVIERTMISNAEITYCDLSNTVFFQTHLNKVIFSHTDANSALFIDSKTYSSSFQYSNPPTSGLIDSKPDSVTYTHCHNPWPNESDTSVLLGKKPNFIPDSTETTEWEELSYMHIKNSALRGNDYWA